MLLELLELGIIGAAEILIVPELGGRSEHLAAAGGEVRWSCTTVQYQVLYAPELLPRLPAACD